MYTSYLHIVSEATPKQCNQERRIKKENRNQRRIVPVACQRRGDFVPRMVMSEVPPDLARQIRLLAAEYGTTQTEVMVRSLHLVIETAELRKQLEAYLKTIGR